jgi:hypothetical protein
MTRLGAKIAVEALDDERYARIENRVVAAFRMQTGDASLRRPWHRRLRVLAPVLALACALALVYVGARWFSLDERTELAHEQVARIVTEGAGGARYQVGDAELVLGPDTVLEFRRELAGAGAGTVHVDLSAGTIDCEVEPAPGRAPFIVHAGDVQVTVVGTMFRVERGDSVRVSVTRGTVRVDAGDGSHVLGAGESWSGPALILAAAEGAGERGASTGDRMIDDTPGQAGATDESGELAMSGPASGLGNRDDGRVLPDLPSSGRGHEARAPASVNNGQDNGQQRGESRPRGSRARSENGRNDATKSKSGKRAPGRSELAKDKPERGHPPAGNTELAALMELESDDAAAALERYREQALGRGAEAEFALYSQAYLQHLALGQSGAALVTLNHYQRRFARGAHRESALWLRIYILCDRSGDLEKCRAAAHTYLSRFPSGRHRTLAGRIINWEL